MAKKLHTQSKLTFKDPHVIRVDHDYTDPDSPDFRQFSKLARERICGTYGYTRPAVEIVKTGPDLPDAIANLFNSNTEAKMRSYWAFQDSMDATTFRLSIGEPAMHVYMWPQTLKFTIYEVIDVESTPAP